MTLRLRGLMRTQFYTASDLNGFIADAENSVDWLFQFGSIEETRYCVTDP